MRRAPLSNTRSKKGADVTGPPPVARARPSRNPLTPALLSCRAGPHLQLPEGPIRAERACPPSRRASAASAAFPRLSSRVNISPELSIVPCLGAVRDADRAAPPRPAAHLPEPVLVVRQGAPRGETPAPRHRREYVPAARPSPEISQIHQPLDRTVRRALLFLSSLRSAAPDDDCFPPRTPASGVRDRV